MQNLQGRRKQHRTPSTAEAARGRSRAAGPGCSPRQPPATPLLLSGTGPASCLQQLIPILAGSSVTVLVTFSNNYSLPLPKPTLLKSQNAPVFLPTYANKKPLCRDPSPSPLPHGAEPRAAPSHTDPVTWAPTLQHRSPTSGHGPSSTGATAIPCRPALAPCSVARCRQPP